MPVDKEILRSILAQTGEENLTDDIYNRSLAKELRSAELVKDEYSTLFDDLDTFKVNAQGDFDRKYGTKLKQLQPKTDSSAVGKLRDSIATDSPFDFESIKKPILSKKEMTPQEYFGQTPQETGGNYIWDAISRGIDNDQGFLYAMGGLVADSLGASKLADGLMKNANENWELAEKTGKTYAMEDNPLAWAGQLILEQVPSMVMTLGSGLVAKTVAKGLLGNATKGAVKKAMQKSIADGVMDKLGKEGAEKFAKEVVKDEMVESISKVGLKDAFTAKGRDAFFTTFGKEFGDDAAKAALGQTRKMAIGNVAVPAVAMGLYGAMATDGDIVKDLFDEHKRLVAAGVDAKEPTLGDLGLGGFVAPMFDMLFPAAIAKQVGILGGASKSLVPEFLQTASKTIEGKKVIRGITEVVGKGMLIEGFTEAAQAVVAETTKKLYMDAYKSGKVTEDQKMEIAEYLLRPEALTRYVAEFMGGAVVGGTFGGVAHAYENMIIKKEDAKVEQVLQNAINAKLGKAKAQADSEAKAKAEAEKTYDGLYTPEIDFLFDRVNHKEDFNIAEGTRQTMAMQEKDYLTRQKDKELAGATDDAQKAEITKKYDEQIAALNVKPEKVKEPTKKEKQAANRAERDVRRENSDKLKQELAGIIEGEKDLIAREESAKRINDQEALGIIAEEFKAGELRKNNIKAELENLKNPKPQPKVEAVKKTPRQAKIESLTSAIASEKSPDIKAGLEKQLAREQEAYGREQQVIAEKKPRVELLNEIVALNKRTDLDADIIAEAVAKVRAKLAQLDDMDIEAAMGGQAETPVTAEATQAPVEQDAVEIMDQAEIINTPARAQEDFDEILAKGSNESEAAADVFAIYGIDTPQDIMDKVSDADLANIADDFGYGESSDAAAMVLEDRRKPAGEATQETEPTAKPQRELQDLAEVWHKGGFTEPNGYVHKNPSASKSRIKDLAKQAGWSGKGNPVSYLATFGKNYWNAPSIYNEYIKSIAELEDLSTKELSAMAQATGDWDGVADPKAFLMRRKRDNLTKVAMGDAKLTPSAPPRARQNNPQASRDRARRNAEAVDRQAKRNTQETVGVVAPVTAAPVTETAGIIEPDYSKMPAWMADNAKLAVQNIINQKKLEPLLDELANYQSAKNAGKKLGIDTNDVLLIRAAYGVPSMQEATGFGGVGSQGISKEYTEWRAKYLASKSKRGIIAEELSQDDIDTMAANLEDGPSQDDLDALLGGLGGDDPQFSRPVNEQEVSTGTRVDTLISFLDSNTPGFLTNARIEVVTSERFPEGGKDWQGAYENGTIYLNADTMDTADVKRILFHESLGHAVARDILGKDYEPVLRTIMKEMSRSLAGKKDVMVGGTSLRDLLKTYEDKLYKNGKINPLVSEEVWAKYIEAHAEGKLSDKNVLFKIFEAIRDFVIKAMGGEVRTLSAVDRLAARAVRFAEFNAVGSKVSFTQSNQGVSNAIQSQSPISNSSITITSDRSVINNSRGLQETAPLALYQSPEGETLSDKTLDLIYGYKGGLVNQSRVHLPGVYDSSSPIASVDGGKVQAFKDDLNRTVIVNVGRSFKSLGRDVQGHDATLVNSESGKKVTVSVTSAEKYFPSRGRQDQGQIAQDAGWGSFDIEGKFQSRSIAVQQLIFDVDSRSFISNIKKDLKEVFGESLRVYDESSDSTGISLPRGEYNNLPKFEDARKTFEEIVNKNIVKYFKDNSLNGMSLTSIENVGDTVGTTWIGYAIELGPSANELKKMAEDTNAFLASVLPDGRGLLIWDDLVEKLPDIATIIAKGKLSFVLDTEESWNGGDAQAYIQRRDYGHIIHVNPSIPAGLTRLHAALHEIGHFIDSRYFRSARGKLMTQGKFIERWEDYANGVVKAGADESAKFVRESYEPKLWSSEYFAEATAEWLLQNSKITKGLKLTGGAPITERNQILGTTINLIQEMMDAGVIDMSLSTFKSDWKGPDVVDPTNVNQVKVYGVLESGKQAKTLGPEVDPQFARSNFKPVDINSKEFKTWFGNSKVVDENGNPKVVYHGSSSGNIRDVDPTIPRSDNQYGPGFYTTEDSDIAGMYSKGKVGELKEDADVGPNITPVYLSIQNPFNINTDTISIDSIYDLLYDRISGDDASSVINEVDNLIKRNGKTGFYTVPQIISAMNASDETAKHKKYIQSKIPEILRSMGYDGLTYAAKGRYDIQEHGVWVAIGDPKINGAQVKSAISNTGNFSSENLGIRYARQVNKPRSQPVDERASKGGMRILGIKMPRMFEEVAILGEIESRLKTTDVNAFDKLLRPSQWISEKMFETVPQLRKMFMTLTEMSDRHREIFNQLSFNARPFLKASKADKIAVEKVLVQGDIDGVEHTTAQAAGLNENQFKLYQSVRSALNNARSHMIADGKRAIAAMEERIKGQENLAPIITKQIKELKASIGALMNLKGYIPRVRPQNAPYDIQYMLDGKVHSEYIDIRGTPGIRAGERRIKELVAKGATPIGGADKITVLERPANHYDQSSLNSKEIAELHNILSSVLKDKEGNALEGVDDLLKALFYAKGFSKHYIRRQKANLSKDGVEIATGSMETELDNGTSVIHGYQTENLDEVLRDYFQGLAGQSSKSETSLKLMDIFEERDAEGKQVFDPFNPKSAGAYDLGKQFLKAAKGAGNDYSKAVRWVNAIQFHAHIGLRFSSALWNMTHIHMFGSGLLRTEMMKAKMKNTPSLLDMSKQFVGAHKDAMMFIKAIKPKLETTADAKVTLSEMGWGQEKADLLDALNRYFAAANGSTLSEQLYAETFGRDAGVPKSMLAQYTKWSGWMMHHSELSNKLASFQMHYQNMGQNFDEAKHFVRLLNGSYEKFNMPGYLQGEGLASGAAQIMLNSFRTHVLNTYENMGSMWKYSKVSFAYSMAAATIMAGVPGKLALDMLIRLIWGVSEGEDQFKGSYERMNEDLFGTSLAKFIKGGIANWLDFVDTSASIGISQHPAVDALSYLTGHGREIALAAPVIGFIKAMNGEAPAYKLMPIKGIQSVFQAFSDSDQLQVGTRKIFNPDGTPMKLAAWESSLVALGLNPARRSGASSQIWEDYQVNDYFNSWKSNTVEAMQDARTVFEKIDAGKQAQEFNKSLMEVKRNPAYSDVVKTKPVSPADAKRTTKGEKTLSREL